ncbi:hypothetical protein [Rivularia sp. UHCC 0363]|uniref:hypothetical protein n=1 Tax=Rivularia sp. UHCC 0363 TaxID=3110244 RepID=UPI002B200405|nr:hypothetical protein [Rivularia sp. UHCC 0363]MEA5595752.1 hypothetical protein [Rivularia sp. UHCC 0363]
MDELANNIAFKVLKYLKPFGDNAGRYIYVNIWRNQLINEEAQKLEIEVTEDLRLIVETKLKNAWQRILESRG